MREIVSPLDGIRSPFGSSVSPLAIYAVLGIRPELVLDFDDEKYFANSSRTTFSDALTHSATTNATMVDSDGLLKWRPHNLLRYSEQFDNAAWIKVNATVTANAAVAPNGTTTADKLVENTANSTHGIIVGVNFASGVAVTLSAFAKAGERAFLQIAIALGAQIDNAFFNLTTGSVGTASAGVSTSITNMGDGWYRCAVTITPTSTGSGFYVIRLGNADNYNLYTGDGTSGIYIWGAHVYRSDLGGMVAVPADARATPSATTYVPTTSAARYLPRRGHHVYNGTSWVNEGLLHESEARTNLLHTTDALVTQSLIVTAVPHTLHFTGTGTVTLLGASTAGPLVGTGTGENNRVSLTFTPTAASLTLTVTGTVTNAQLEVGSTPSSYIPNLAASGSVTRAAETLTIPSAKLPWPTPNVIGPELVTNGDFSDGTNDWSVIHGVFSVVDGALRVEEDGVNASTPRGYQAIATEIGKVYRATADLVGLNIAATGSLVASTNTNTGGFPSVNVVSGTGELIFVAQATTTNIILTANSTTTGAYADWDNISVREINPLAVSIQMQGRMTYADTGIGVAVDGLTGEVMFASWRLDKSNYIVLGLSTGSTATGQPVFLQEASVVFDYVNPAVSPYSPGINVPFNIASRHGSTFINGAVDGTALTADTTPTALPDLSATDLNLGYDYNGTIKQLRIWADDLTDAGLEAASS